MNPLFEFPVEWLVDPITKESLVHKNGKLISSVCKYGKQDGFWDLRPDRSLLKDKEYWEIWDHLQLNGLISYQEDPEHNLGVGKRKDFIDFSVFCDSRGDVLDVGCGPQKHPTHMKYCLNKDVRFIGIDPLLGEDNRNFAFSLGVAEYLPFRDRLFDQVLFVTTLDHFIDPLAALREAKRVLKNNGEICIWIGEKAPETPKPGKTHSWYEALEVPDGAADKFHFKKFTIDQFETYCMDLNLRVIDKQINQLDAWRKNLFYKIRP